MSYDDYTDELNPNRVTKRQVMKAAIAAGISPIAASRMTVSDVKAADSDQTTIPLDTEGRYKTQVPKDWFNHLQRAFKVKAEMKSRFSGKRGIAGIGISAGEFGGDNPHVTVDLDKDSEEKHERRGEVPEERENVRIDTAETGKGAKALCDDGYSDQSEVKGGIHVNMKDNSSGLGPNSSITSRLINGSNKSFGFGWATCAHCLPNCPPADWDGDMVVDHNADGNTRWIGKVVFWDPIYDFAAIEAYDDENPVSRMADPRYPNNDYFDHHISATLSKSGLSTLEGRGHTFLMRGQESCELSGTIHRVEKTQYMYDDCAGSGSSGARLEKQVEWSGEAAEGDSGGLIYSEPVEDQGNQRFAASLLGWYDPASFYGQTSGGGAGYAIREDRNCWWDDL